MDNCTGLERDARFRWRSAIGRECSGEGPNTFPFPRQLRLTSEAVDLQTAGGHAAAVSQVLQSLDEHAMLDPVSAPDLSWLRLAHPCNTREHAAHLCELASVHMSAAKPGEELAAVLASGAHFVQNRWAAAYGRLKSIPRQYPSSAHAASSVYPVVPEQIWGGSERPHASSSQVVVQIAFHTPDNNFTRSHVVLAAACHTLAQVKDAVRCINNQHASDLLGYVPAGGYMFVGNTLYVDDRDPSACNFHEPILKFLGKQATQVGQAVWKYLHANGLAIAQSEDSVVPPVKSMAMVRLCDLQLLPGQHGQYVFAHVGACEHMMIIEDVRLKHAMDPSLDEGPAVIRAAPEALSKCCICTLRPGVTLACEDKMAPMSPAVFCETCFASLHSPSADLVARRGCNEAWQDAMDSFCVHV
eukprot:jgi/Ulvmu1/4660/UM002_0391.1